MTFIFSYRNMPIGICVYGMGALHYSELQPHCCGYQLYQIVKDMYKVPVEFQILVHKGKLVQPLVSLENQGFVHGATVFMSTKSKGGGKDSPPTSPHPGNLKFERERTLQVLITHLQKRQYHMFLVTQVQMTLPLTAIQKYSESQ